jgi:nitrogen fixation/metabolism regulation signal transduction histidine kinase
MTKVLCGLALAAVAVVVLVALVFNGQSVEPHSMLVGAPTIVPQGNHQVCLPEYPDEPECASATP